MSFHDTQNQEYLDAVTHRLDNEYLDWVEQFLDIIGNHNKFSVRSSPKILNDIGCNVGQFYKGLLRRKSFLSYRGFDIEEQYLDVFRKKYPEAHIINLDITKKDLPESDISVTSAVLEHLTSREQPLKNILQSTRELCIIRTYLGEQDVFDMIYKSGAKESYPLIQHSFSHLCGFFERYGFKVSIERDKATDSLPKYIGNGIIRTQYVLVGTK